MVLRRFATALCALAFASTAEAQRGQGGFTGFNGAGFATARGSDGPRPLLFGFAVECSRCTSVGRRGQGGGRGPAAVWQYEENPRIAVVVTGSAAERAGIRVGDHLVAVDGKSITTDEGSRRFSELRAGDSTRLTLERAGKTLDVSIVLGVTRGGGRGGVANAASNDLPGFVTYTPDTRVEIWSDTRVVESTDSTGATILRIGNTKIRLAPTTPGAARTGRGLTGNGRRGFPP